MISNANTIEANVACVELLLEALDRGERHAARVEVGDRVRPVADAERVPEILGHRADVPHAVLAFLVAPRRHGHLRHALQDVLLARGVGSESELEERAVAIAHEWAHDHDH